MTLAEIRSYLRDTFPQVFATQDIVVETAAGGSASLRLEPGEQHLRPGNIVSGPTLMMLADAGAYAALLSQSEAARMAVTTNLNISFLRASALGRPILMEARVMKEGRRLAVLVCEAKAPDGRVLAHATVTYAMPAP